MIIARRMHKKTKTKKKKKKKRRRKKRSGSRSLRRAVRIAAPNCMRFCMGDVTYPSHFDGKGGRMKRESIAGAGLRVKKKKTKKKKRPGPGTRFVADWPVGC